MKYMDIKKAIKNNRIMHPFFYLGKSVLYYLIQEFYKLKFFLYNLHMVKILRNEDARFGLISKYKNIHKGERCFIVATGPSLTLEDLELLKNEVTFSMNSIPLLYEKTDFRPTYYAIQDKTVMDKIKDGLVKVKADSMFVGISNMGRMCKSGIQLSDVKEYPESRLFHLDVASIFYHLNYKHDCFQPDFSLQCEKKVCDGATITYSVIQLAAYMGFSKIYLLGVDCSYAGSKKHMVEYDKDADYTDTAEMIYKKWCKSYRLARKELEKRGVKLYNATRGGALEELPRVNLDELIKLQ